MATIPSQPGDFGALVSLGAREHLEAMARRRRLRREEALFREGEEAHSVAFITSGVLRVERVTVSGYRQVLTLAGRGDVFGELAVLDGSRRSATGVAMRSTDVLLVSARDLHAAFDVFPEIALAFARRMADRQRALTEQLLETTGGTAMTRTAARILQLVDTDVVEGTFEIDVGISQAELAAWAGLSREGTVKALREMRDRGIVETARQRITVHDVAALRREALGD